MLKMSCLPLALGLLLSSRASAFPPQQPLSLRPLDHSQGYQFDPLLHLPGISPYFDAVGFGLNHDAPEGCRVNAASYLIRHGAIYANDDEYEEYIKPFLAKLDAHRGGFSGPLAFLNEWQSPIDEDHLEDVTPSGKRDAEKVGHHLLKRYRHLASPLKRVIADTKARTYDTARAFVKALSGDDEVEVVRYDKKELNNGTRALLPHKACSNFSKSPGAKQQKKFLHVYGRDVARRLSPHTPKGLTLEPEDVLALQSLCGYESGIRGESSPICPVFSDTEWLSYEYAWDMRYAHMVGPLNPLSNHLGYPWLLAQSDLFKALDDDPDAVDNDDDTWPAGQRLFLYFTHREVPPFIATALGIFNSSAREGLDEFPTSGVNFARAWKMSDLIPFLGHVGMEKMTCQRPGPGGDEAEPETNEYIRFIANTAPRPLPRCQSGPGASCPFDEFQDIINAGAKKYDNFDEVCGNKGKGAV